MANFAMIVEGAHDASFLGKLLKVRGFQAVRKIGDVPGRWKLLFPKVFPMDGENLERVMRFPEIYVRDGDVVGITTSGSDSQLISTVRAVVDVLGSSELRSIGIFADIDGHDKDARFSEFVDAINAMNKAAAAEGEPGYPLAVPASLGCMETGPPAIGIYLFPDNDQPGALENILVDCAGANHKAIADASIKLVADLDASCPPDQADLKRLRAGMGRAKAVAGTIANLLKPGVSLAVSLAQTDWLTGHAGELEVVEKVDAFLDNLLA
ncbi:hypothetical protein GRI44_13080 [Altererythrobacter confluentis]|uniref:DUF4276 family protein n=1 Tax=Allopontixanthobacter confluentis TaxID=1849021 RepID=A0A6L7GHZ6_9SPHN|nr:DUF3226 domain-containing protein [Allopontixanthobacter confluentis]MXP15683.1 hypothetical protein [Allopontixanthobacter confluentis]